MASVISVNISAQKGTVKHPVDQIRLKIGHGIVGDAHAGNWPRQISLLAQESVDRMAALGVDGLEPGIFAENITTQGIQLHTLPIGTRLKIGGCVVEVTQIGKECHQGCEIFKRVGMCVMPKEGIFAKVITQGLVQKGDAIRLMPAGAEE